MKKKFPMRLHVNDGALTFEDGTEAALWGVNFQPNLYWEYAFRMEPLGIPLSIKTMQAMTDHGFDDLQKMNCADVIRCHLCPSDFADGEGNLVDNLWLEMFDYLLAEAGRRGIYVFLTFLNQMEFTFVEGSFLSGCPRREWMFNPDCVKASRSFIRQLLNHTNRFTGLALKDDAVICAWELINEPDYIDWSMVNDRPDHLEKNRTCAVESYKQQFHDWCEETGAARNDWYFRSFRQQRVRGYIDGMIDLIRSAGARQPVVWNCNWPRMIEEHRDVFAGIAESRADAVSVCCYPGQDEVDFPLVENEKNMEGHNFLPFLKRCRDDHDHLGWLLDDAFAAKAKIVYEFEQLYDAESSYLYPAMAKLFRSLGVQMATMWTWCFDTYADRYGHAHHLNLKTTPAKAASFMAAAEGFRRLPRGFAYETLGETEDRFEGVELSFEDHCSCFCADGTLIYSAWNEWPRPAGAELRRIIGRGSSPFVSYEGTGLYFIEKEGDEIRVEILPDSHFVRDHWRWFKDGEPVVELDDQTARPFELRWPGQEPVRFDAVPGMYTVTCSQYETINVSL